RLTLWGPLVADRLLRSNGERSSLSDFEQSICRFERRRSSTGQFEGYPAKIERSGGHHSRESRTGRQDGDGGAELRGHWFARERETRKGNAEDVWRWWNGEGRAD